MKNLALIRYVRRNISETRDIGCFCTDPQAADAFVQIKDTIFKLTCDGNLETVYCFKEHFLNDTVSEIVHMSYNSILNSICLAFLNGDLVTIDLISKTMQCVGYVESGFKAAEWSPDQEILILITGSDTIIVMSLSFDPITEVELNQKGFGEKQFITVGWGKKETQFHGSEGKAAAHKSEKAISKISDLDDHKPRISWRGDGNLFVINTVNPETLSRHLRIFSRDGVLQYTSEYVSGLEEPLSWRPSGNIIATSQRLPNKHIIAFYEKNGLRHGEFALPFEPEECKVRMLSWNTESTILAVWCENRRNEQVVLQLWTVNNYHWYLKQSIQFASGNELLAIEWNVIQGCRLHLLSKGTEYETYDWKWSVHHSNDVSKHDDAAVAVIDGRKVLITAFRRSIMPPPLCNQTLALSASANYVMFAPSTISDKLPEAFSALDTNSLCVIMDNGNASIFVRLPSLRYEKWLDFQIEHALPGRLHHWLWLTANEFIACCSTTKGDTEIMLMHLDINEKKLFCRSGTYVEGSVTLIVRIPNHVNQVVIQLDTGVLLQLKTVDMSICRVASPLPEPCYDIQICHVNDQDVTFSLSNRSRLYMDGKEVANNVTSMTVHSEFLLLTTLRHMLLCVRLDADGLQKLASGEIGPGRQIERGARLVRAIPYDTAVILQMPRGNLECIHPRPLTLHVAAAELNAGNYKDTFLLFRKHRINLNLLCDFRPEKFLSEVDQFVKQLTDPSWLSLFLSELQHENVVHTMYREYLDNKPTAVSNKVNTICSAVREAMLQQQSPEELLFPILTSHVKQGTDKDLSEALLRVKALKEEGKTGVDEALRHLLYLEDVNRLYNIALGLYDFDLVMLVAAKSNKDPKEYVAFLNDLRRMQPDYRHFVIDKQLKRFESALHHISRCSEEEHFNECLALLKDNYYLYSKALRLFPKGSERYQRITAAYAEHLKERMLYEEAGIMYVRAARYYDALLVFQRAGNWREALHMADKLQYKENQLQVLCQELVTGQIGRRNYSDAAQILRVHLNDTERSVKVLVQGRKWDEAMSECFCCKQDGYIDKIVKPAVEEYLDQLTGQLTSIKEQFGTYVTRLEIVRENKQKSLLEEKKDVKDESDLYSDTSSHTGSKSSSGRSSRSSKSKRKQERKLLRIKEGSPYEDLALIRALYQLIVEAHALKEEVHNLCKILMRLDNDQDAAKLQALLANLINDMEDSREDIWTPDLLDQTATEFGPDATVNSITSNLQMQQNVNVGLSLLEPQFRFPPATKFDSSWQFSILRL